MTMKMKSKILFLFMLCLTFNTYAQIRTQVLSYPVEFNNADVFFQEEKEPHLVTTELMNILYNSTAKFINSS